MIIKTEPPAIIWPQDNGTPPACCSQNVMEFPRRAGMMKKSAPMKRRVAHPNWVFFSCFLVISISAERYGWVSQKVPITIARSFDFKTTERFKRKLHPLVGKYFYYSMNRPTTNPKNPMTKSIRARTGLMMITKILRISSNAHIALTHFALFRPFISCAI